MPLFSELSGNNIPFGISIRIFGFPNGMLRSWKGDSNFSKNYLLEENCLWGKSSLREEGNAISRLRQRSPFHRSP